MHNLRISANSTRTSSKQVWTHTVYHFLQTLIAFFIFRTFFTSSLSCYMRIGRFCCFCSIDGQKTEDYLVRSDLYGIFCRFWQRRKLWKSKSCLLVSFATRLSRLSWYICMIVNSSLELLPYRTRLLWEKILRCLKMALSSCTNLECTEILNSYVFICSNNLSH